MEKTGRDDLEVLGIENRSNLEVLVIENRRAEHTERQERYETGKTRASKIGLECMGIA